MNKHITVFAVLLTVLLFACAVLGSLSFVPEGELRTQFQAIVATFGLTTRAVLTVAAVVIAVWLVASLFYFLAIGWQFWQRFTQAAVMSKLKTEEYRVQIARQRFIIEAAPAGSQIFKLDVLENLTDPLHLAPGRVNGKQENESRQDRLERWASYQFLHSTSKPAQLGSGSRGQLAAPDQPKVLKPILPLLVEAQRLILNGGSDSGKTTLVKHIIAGRADHSKIIIIDPHSPSRLLGLDVIGAGRNYAAIGEALESLVLLMDSRYQDVKAGLFGYGQHERVSVFVDEWTSISEKVAGAGDMLKTLLTESRKVNIHLAFCTHSTRIEVLGIDAQIRKSATIVELVGGNGQPHRGFILPQSKMTVEGKKAAPVEYALPGPFPGYVQPAGEVVQNLPDSKALKAQLLAAQGFSVTAIARELFGTDKATGPQIAEVKRLLGLAEAT